MDEDDVNADIPHNGERGGGNKPTSWDGGEEDSKKIEAGKRTNRWYNRVERIAEENRKRSIQNRNYLARLEWRTVWIVRLLIATIGTVLGGVAVQFIIA